VLAILDECRERLGLRLGRPLTLMEVPELESPALFGCFRLKLLLPQDLLARFSPTELRHVFLHELAHVRRGDAAMNWLTTILQTLHWFNPVLWFAFHRMRADREVACDALVLAAESV
jgi:bla regulator protein BlaR1